MNQKNALHKFLTQSLVMYLEYLVGASSKRFSASGARSVRGERFDKNRYISHGLLVKRLCISGVYIEVHWNL